MKNSILEPVALISIILLLSSCASSEKIIYFQDIEGVELKDSIMNFEPTIQIGDELFINVSSTDPEAAIPFNLYETPVVGNAFSNAKPLTYLVNVDGAINFPVLGTIHVKGETKKGLTSKLKTLLIVHIKEPTINIRLVNFQVSVIGEVTKPGTFIIKDEQITVLEALGLAGDLTIYGERKLVLLIREVDSEREFVTIDLTNKELFNSPYYYLKQNDVIYVTPNRTRVNSSSVGPNTAIILSSVSVLIALLPIIIK
jgi:polysaccharide biosynthesis/export protein